LFVAVLVFSVCDISAFACQCGAGYRGKNTWENAMQAADASAIIFEGTPVRFELKWDLLTAKEGDLIPVEMYSKVADRDPHMVVTFRVQRAYKGNLPSEVQVHTGLGGGDCGATYATGLEYLVFGGSSNPSELGVSMCSPGGWTGDHEVAADLRYLRQQRPMAADLAPLRPWGRQESRQEMQRRIRGYEESHKHYVEATGRICGNMAGTYEKEAGGGIVFLSTLGYSPATFLYTAIQEDGLFCSPDLGPGSYYLLYVRGTEHPLALYYPGVTNVSSAAPIRINAGQSVQDVVFKVQEQSSYSVRGLISAESRPDLAANAGLGEVTVSLVRLDGGRRVWYSERASFLLPRLGYFRFDHVVPGRYVAWIAGPGDGWLMRKVEVDVTSHMKFISLDLVRKK
jgi:hypothetical protein